MTAAPEPVEWWSGRSTARIVGVTYRQLDYWDRTRLLSPSVRPASGSGGWETHGRRYSRDDLLTLVLVRTLLEAGVRLERVREILPTLPDQWTGEPGGFVVVPPFGRAIYATDAAELAATIDTGVPAVIVVGLAPIRRTLTDNLTAPAGVGLPDHEPALTAG